MIVLSKWKLLIFCHQVCFFTYRIVQVRAFPHQGFPITYDLMTESNEDSSEFDIDTSNGWVELQNELDYEKDPIKYLLKVRAVEHGNPPRTSTVEVSHKLI